MSIFGRSFGTCISGKLFKDGKEITIKTVSDAIKNGIAYATEDRKQYGLNLIDDIRHNVAPLACLSSRAEASSMDTRSWRSPPNTRSE